MILIPEVKILEIIDIAIKTVEIDYYSTIDTKSTLLYKIFGGNKIGKFDFFEQAKDIFLRSVDHPRKIATRMLFDTSRAGLPTIHVTMPAENASSDGIGIDEGYVDSELDTVHKKVITTYTRGFDTTYNCIITSDNATEVLCIYHLLKSMLISIFDTIEFSGIRNVKLSGQDLQINSELVPINLYSRGIGISCLYEQSVPKVQKDDLIKSVEVLRASGFSFDIKNNAYICSDK